MWDWDSCEIQRVHSPPELLIMTPGYTWRGNPPKSWDTDLVNPSCWSPPATSSQPVSLCQGDSASPGVLACIRPLFPFLNFVAAAEQDPLKLGAKGNLHHPLLPWKRSVWGAERNSRKFHLKCAGIKRAASFPVLPPSSKGRQQSSGEGKHRNHKLEPQAGPKEAGGNIPARKEIEPSHKMLHSDTFPDNTGGPLLYIPHCQACHI